MGRVAINGLGRIGRAALRILLDTEGFEPVAVNDVVPANNLAYLIRHDTVYGRYGKPVDAEESALVIDGRKIQLFSERDPAALPWRDLGIDLVFECTGVFREEADLNKHLAAGAKFVILSAPARTETVATVVPGVNRPGEKTHIVSCASCTTNCVAPSSRWSIAASGSSEPS